MFPSDVAEWAGEMCIMKSAKSDSAEAFCFMKDVSEENMNSDNSTMDFSDLNLGTCDILQFSSLDNLDNLLSLLNNPEQDNFLNSKTSSHSNSAELGDDLDLSTAATGVPDKCEDSLSNINFDSNKALSVLGVDLDLYFTSDRHSENVFDEDIDRLLDKNIAGKCFDSDQIDNFFSDTFNCDFFEDAPLHEDEPKQQTPNLPDSVQLISMFPHIADEKNKRRRSLLYEKSFSGERNQHNKRDNSEEYNYRARALLSHDYTNKKLDEGKSFICPIENCHKVYNKSSHLKSHLRRHAGEKPFVCTWQNCTWKFSRSDELARHLRSHSGIKPHKCDICDKAFSRSDHLSKHIKVHRKRVTNFSNYTIKKPVPANSLALLDR